MADYKQNPVSETVWPWTNPPPEEDHDPRPSTLMAFIGLGIGLGVASLLHFKFHHTTMAIVVTSIASIVFLLGLTSKKGYAVVHKIFMAIAFVINKVLSYALLLPFYYIVFSLGHLCQKIAGKDPMKRAFPTNDPSYWVERKPVTDPESYRRQS